MGLAGTILAPGAACGHWSALETLPCQSLPGSGKFGRQRFSVVGPGAHFQDIAQSIPSPQSASRVRLKLPPELTLDSGTLDRPLFHVPSYHANNRLWPRCHVLLYRRVQSER